MLRVAAWLLCAGLLVTALLTTLKQWGFVSQLLRAREAAGNGRILDVAVRWPWLELDSHQGEVVVQDCDELTLLRRTPGERWTATVL